MPKLLIPNYAKLSAKRAIALRKSLSKSKKFSLSKKQARRLGIISGVQQGKYLIKHKYLTFKKAVPYYRFYQRFKNCRTKKCKGAMDLWGGRKFLKTKVFRFVKKYARKKP